MAFIAEESETAKAFDDPQPTESNQIPAIDKKAMIAQMGAFDEQAIEMLGMFIEMTEPLISRIMIAHNKNDHHDLKEAAHSLKGAARSACCNVLGDLASELQDRAEGGEDCEALVPEIEFEFARVKMEVSGLKS